MLSFDQIEHGRQLQKASVADRNRAVVTLSNQGPDKEYEVQSAEHDEEQELQAADDCKDQALRAAQDEKTIAAAFNVVEKMLTTALNHSRVLSGRAGRVRQPLWDLLLDMKMRHNLDFGAEEMDEARKAAGIAVVDYTY